LSAATGAAHVTTLPHWVLPTPVVVTIFAGQTIVGLVSSFTVTVNVQVWVLPFTSVAVTVTVVGVPFAKKDPDAGLEVTLDIAQLSVAVGAAQVTTLPQAVLPAPVVVTIFAGQVICGLVLSITITVNTQVCVLPAASLAV
jgi:hypothetical protein